MEEDIPGELEVLLSRGIPKSVVLSACRLAAKSGMTPAEYLLENALVNSDTLYSAYAEHCGVPFLPDRGFRPQSLNDRAMQFGDPYHGPLLVSLHNSTATYAISPSCDQFDAVHEHLKRFPEFARQVRIVSPQAMQHATSIMSGPSGDLQSRFPDFSAHLRLSNGQKLALLLTLFAFVAGVAVPAVVWFFGLCTVFAAICFSSGAARLAGAIATQTDRTTFELAAPFSSPKILWPKYTILVPLYREARVVRSLVANLKRLDYPRDRLQVLFLTEQDDRETFDAFDRPLPDYMEVVRVPRGTPQTKPRALAHGLHLTTGEFVTIYDAEDRPEADQLKKAALLFALAPQSLACLQARLVADNDADSFFSRQFALEYACLFDQLIPWFHRNNWPFPLGGTSNHFRRSALEAVGGWDKFNVTEDADLGVRLARFGYRTGVLASATYEEAPISWRAWFAQRARWYKGWFQTVLVHTRDPLRTGRELGWKRFGALAVMFVGSLLLIALHPVFCVVFAAYLVGLVPPPLSGSAANGAFLGLCIGASLAGYIGAAAALWLAAAKRGLSPRIRDLFGLPFYWLCTGAACYRAIWEFLVSPYHWNKIEHGLTKFRRLD